MVTDIEIIEWLLKELYANGEYVVLVTDRLPEAIEGANYQDIMRVIRKMESLDIMKAGSTKEYDHVRLTDKGMELMREHGSYVKYLEYKEKQDTKKDRIEAKDRTVKNIGILITIGVSLLTLFLTQYNRWKDKQEKEKEVISPIIEMKIDSLLKVLSPNKIDTTLLLKGDTAISK